MEKSIPWIEKYRPQVFEDIILDPQIVIQINAFTSKASNIHLIITGPPGLGKTTTVKCIAKKILGENLQTGYLELNAAEDRGVKSMSNIIPPFCKKTVNFTEPRIILLDEADNLTSKCQVDIVSMIKQFGHKTKFVFTCNDSNKISEDIQSVCRIIQFKPLNNEQVNTYLAKICNIEGVKFNKGGLDTIFYISSGDMRKAINNLQLVAYSYSTNVITKATVLKVCKLPDPDEINQIINFCTKADIISASDILEKIMDDGYCYSDIINIFIFVLLPSEINESQKINMLDIIQQTKIIISSKTRSKLQLTAMIARICKLYLT